MIGGRGQGIGFAVPSSMAQRVADQILRTGHVTRGWIGVSVQDVTPELAAALSLNPGAGALVNNVAPEGPAFHANLRPGDVIASVAGHPVHEGHDLIRETMTHEVGQPIALEIVRGGKHYAASMTLAERPEPAVEPTPAQQAPSARQGLGLVVRDLAPAQAAQMNLPSKPTPILTQVAPGSAADRSGLRPGDVILEANGVAEPTSAQVADLARSGGLVLRVKRGDAFFYAALKH